MTYPVRRPVGARTAVRYGPEPGRSGPQSRTRPGERLPPVVLPQLRPAIAAGALLVVLYTLSDFAAVSLLQFESFTQAIYVQYQATFNRSYAAVLSLVLVALTAVILFAGGPRSRPGRYYRAGTGSARRARLVPLGRVALAGAGLLRRRRGAVRSDARHGQRSIGLHPGHRHRTGRRLPVGRSA